MVPYEQAVKGFARYVDNEMLPHMSGFKKVGLGAYTALVARNAVQTLKGAAANPAVSLTGVVAPEGLELELLYSAVCERITENIQLDIPMIGVFTVSRADVDKLYNYMRGAL